MFKKGIILLFASILTLVACHPPVYNQTMGNVSDVKLTAKEARKRSDDQAKPLPPLVVKQGHYVDTTPRSLYRQPSWLRNHIVIRGDQLPFSYFSRTIANAANHQILPKYQPGLDSKIKISVNYSGTVQGALDLIATQSGYVYSVRGNIVYWQAYLTKTFDIAFMPGEADYFMGNKGGGGSTASQASGGAVSNFVSSDSSDAEFSSLKGKLSVWKDLESTIKQMLSKDGTVMVSQATTTVTVRDKPTNINLVSEYIHNLNNRLSKQVLIKVQVLEVNLENDFQFGINWALIAKSFTHSRYFLSGNYGTPIAITAFTSQPTGQTVPMIGLKDSNSNPPSYTVLLNALNQQGHTSIVSEPRVVSLNNQVSVVKIVTQEGYLASVQNTTVAGSAGGNAATVTSQLTPGNIVTGLTLYILPKILQDKIYLQVNADLSTNVGLGEYGTTDTKIQLPNITEKHFNQRSMIKSGDTLILSGFRQVKNTARANQLLTSQALGGKGSQQLSVETIVLITPIILNGSA